MKKKAFARVLATLLSVIMLFSAFSLNAFAASVNYDESKGSTYYQLISKRDWEIAPGVDETEIILNNESGSRRQVVHTIEVDLNNPYTKVISGYKGMWPEEGNYGTESTSVQALNAEKLGYGNVVAATNCSLSWYNDDYYKQNPHLIGEPLGYTILDGQYYTNSKGHGEGVKTVIVINYDKHPLTGEDRPEDMPKVWIRDSKDPLTGWEEQAIPVLFEFLVKPDKDGNPVNQYKENHGSDIASRTFVGVKADGTLVVSVSDGEQAPYSTGFTNYEQADFLIKMGCVVAARCDGGGSTTFCTQRPGEDLKVNCSLSDGGERPTTNTILVISTAPADGVFARATISADYDYYTPGSSVTFSALGTDAVGTKVDIPENVEWAIKENGMGTIENGVFKSNGTEGTVTAQMIYEGNVVGEKTITVVTPDRIYFEQPVVTIPFGKTAKVPVKATAQIGGVNFEIGLGDNDISFTTTNEKLGHFDGLNFIAVDEENAPPDLTSTVTATLKMGKNPTATVKLNLGKGSEVLWDFEGGQKDIDIWNVINNRNGPHRDYYMKLSLADRTNGQVHDGNYSMRLEINGLSSAVSDSGEYAWIRLGVDGEAVVLKNARSVGFWLYVPEDNIQCWVQGHYMTDSNGDGTYDNMSTVSMMESENVYYNIDESGWHYMSMDISAFEEVALKYSSQFDKDPSDGTAGEKGEFFLAIITHRTKNNLLWQTNGTINGPYTYYLDGFTVDYSEAVDDRENPVFDKVYLDGTALVKRDVITTNNNILNLSVAVADQTQKEDAMGVLQPLYNVSGLDANTAKAYIDGVEVKADFDGSKITVNGLAVADGYHRVKFEICDKMGNKSVIIRVIKVESGVKASTIKVVPNDPTLDRIPFGSIYWMNLEATNIETIKSVETVIDLNSVNHWQLDYMELAEGFTADYTINKETNTATIKLTRTGENTQTGAAVLAKLPVRILYFDTDIKVPGFTAETYWTTYNFFAQDMKMDVDMGVITYVDGYKSDVMGVFSNEEFHVDTEMYTTNQAIDKVYFAEHGTTHVHTPVAIADKAATCVENGYSDRTFCEGCNSVVEWGTVIKATGHSYEVVGDKLICDCGKACTTTGLQTVDGKNYYIVNGKLTSGWLTIDEIWYYFDKTTYAGVDGKCHIEGATTFTFENGRLLSGSWVRYPDGIRYWYGPSYYRETSPHPLSSRPYVIDGKTYLFSKSGYMQKGVQLFFNGADVEYYDCGEDGVATLLTGVYNDQFYVDGILQDPYQLIEHDGNYYLTHDERKIVKNRQVYVSELYINGLTYPNGNPILPGVYTFDEEGKMVILDGVIGDYLYISGIRQEAYQLIKCNGAYYFISDGHKLVKGRQMYISEQFINGLTYPNGNPILPGTFTFDEEGKMVILEGVVGDYLYINGVQPKAYKLVEYNGNIYLPYDGRKLVKNRQMYVSEQFIDGLTYENGSPILPGTYTFDEEGKMVILEGVVGDYLYINGAQPKAYKLVEYKGSYYLPYDGRKLVKGRQMYLSEEFINGLTYPNGNPILPGTYMFDEEGRMIILDGVVGDYLYINGVQPKAYKLVEYNGSLYLPYDGRKLVKNRQMYVSEQFIDGLTYENGSPILPGVYTFDEEGRMIILDGVVGDYLYINGAQPKAYKLVEYKGSYYLPYDGRKLVKGRQMYLSEEFINGLTYPDGSPILPGTYMFDEEGRMIILDGVVGDYLYINGVRQEAYQLIKYNGDYYFVSDEHKLVKGKQIYLSEKFINGLTYPNGSPVLAGTYMFDENGKMILLDGVVGDYLYINGVRQEAYQLVEYNGDFYFISDGHKIAKNVTMRLTEKYVAGKTFADGTQMGVANYTFGEDGKMDLSWL